MKITVLKPLTDLPPEPESENSAPEGSGLNRGPFSRGEDGRTYMDPDYPLASAIATGNAERARERHMSSDDDITREANNDRSLYLDGFLTIAQYEGRVQSRMREMRRDLAREQLRANAALYSFQQGMLTYDQYRHRVHEQTRRQRQRQRQHEEGMARDHGMVGTYEWLGTTPDNRTPTRDVRRLTTDEFREQFLNGPTAREREQALVPTPPEAPGMRQDADATTRRQRLLARYNHLFNSRSTTS